MILALDIATNTGWAVGGYGHPIIFGSRSFDAYTGRRAIMGTKFAMWLDTMVATYKPKGIAIEAPILQGGGAPGLLIPLTYEAEKAALRHMIGFRQYAPNTVKKFMTGNGKASKDDMIIRAQAMNFDVKNSDQADAIAVLKLHESMNNGKDPSLQ